MSEYRRTAKKYVRTSIAFALLVFAAGCASVRGTTSAKVQDDDLMRIAVEMRTAVRYAADPTSRAFGELDMALEPLGGDVPECGPIRAVRVSFPSAPHLQKFVVAVEDEKLFRLGGFSSPDVAGFVASVQRGPATPEVMDIARCLARLLDPNGALWIVPVGDTVSIEQGPPHESVWRQWISVREGYNTIDTVTERPDGSRWVRVSVLSGQNVIGGMQWSWRSYVFAFDRSGTLLVWHVRVDEPISLP